LRTNKDVIRFDIAMDNITVVGILQCGGNLVDVLDNNVKRKPLAFMSGKRSVGRILQNEERYVFLDIEIVELHDIRMMQDCRSFGLLLELLLIYIRKL